MTGKTSVTRAERLRQRRQKQRPLEAETRLDSIRPETTNDAEPDVRTTHRRGRPERHPAAEQGSSAGARTGAGSLSPVSLLLPGKPGLQRRAPAGKPGQRYATVTTNAMRGTPTLGRGQFTRHGGTQHGARGGGFDIAFSLGRADVRAPAISLPQYGPRLVSGLLSLLLAFLLYSLWTGPVFIVSAAEVSGNQRLQALEINAMLGMAGQPVFKAVPAQIELNLRTAYPDISSAEVRVAFPNRITVEVVERMPRLAWYQDGALTWIDADGIAFLPRGEAQASDLGGLIQVTSNGAPPQVQVDPDAPLYEQKFVAPELVEAMVTLFPYVPAGIPMIFDPQYGMGWQDPRGWFVYFGQNTVEIPVKLAIYQAIVDTFIRQGIQPMLVSVEHLDAPFYK